MSQPVKLSDGLVNEARVAGAAMQRSIAGQVEFWANLGRAMERVMSGGMMMQVRVKASAAELWESLEGVNTAEGRRQLTEYLESKPYPRFMAHPTEAEVFIREGADGSRVEGTILGGEFVPKGVPKTSEAA